MKLNKNQEKNKKIKAVAVTVTVTMKKKLKKVSMNLKENFHKKNNPKLKLLKKYRKILKNKNYHTQIEKA